MFGLHSKFKYKQVVIVREDLKLSKGKLSVQVAHAAVSCAIKAEKNKNNFFLEWFTEGQKKVVLKVENLDFLLKIFNEAKTIGPVSYTHLTLPTIYSV